MAQARPAGTAVPPCCCSLAHARSRFGRLAGVEFTSLYDQGFARVAACAVPVAVADPRANADAVLQEARACHDEGVAVAVFPELALTGYSVEDLFLQEAVLDAVEEQVARSPGVRRAHAGARGRRAAAPRQPAAQRARWWCTGAGCSAWRRSRTCRPTGSSTSAGTSPPATTAVASRSCSAAWRCRSARTCSSAPPTWRGWRCTSRCARTCGCRCRRAPRPRSPARRCWPTSPAARSPSAAPRTVGCWSARRPRAAWRPTCTPRPDPGESSTDLSWDGQTMIYEMGELLAETERFPEGPRCSIADVDLMRIRQDRMRQGTFDDNRRTLEDRGGRGSAPSSSRSTRRAGTSGCGARSTGSRSCPTTRTARPGLLRGLQHPGLGARAAAARDRQPEGRHRRLRRPGLHPRAHRRGRSDGPARPPAQRHPRVHDARLRDQRHHQEQRHPALASPSA